MSDLRDGETTLPFDPADRAEAGVAFIGRIRSPWSRGDCPRNIGQARDSGQGARVELDPAYRDALTGLRVGQPIILLYWMDRGGRTLLIQRPRHVEGPRGTFSLRSPKRPNPIAMASVILTGIDLAACVLEIDAIDCFDMTPLVDIKPWIPTVDVPPGWTPDG